MPPSTHHDQDVARVHGVADGHTDLGHRPRRGRPELVLHLHRLDHKQDIAGVDGIAGADGDAADLTRKWRRERAAPRPRPGTAAGPADMARLLLDVALVQLAAYLDDA